MTPHKPTPLSTQTYRAGQSSQPGDEPDQSGLTNRLLRTGTFTLRRQPFLYLSAFLILGILADRFIEPPYRSGLALAIALFAVSIWFVHRQRHFAATLAVLIAFAGCGASLSHNERANIADSRLAALFDKQIITPNDAVELTGVLVTPPEPAPQAYYLDIEAESLRLRGEAHPASGRVRAVITLPSDEATRHFADLKLNYGTRIRVLIRLERARTFCNPGSPDFGEYLERHGYDLRGAIKSSLLIEPIGRRSLNPVLGVLYDIRLRLMNAIDRCFTTTVAGTLKAMLTGNRYFIDATTTERLRESATFHTLVIAGLHVGIIAWLVLGGRSGLRRRSRAQVIVALAVLWAYAVMVGLAPPVTRATLMITAGLVGPLLFRQAASLNSVAMAAFVMLAFKPALVADPGFQLSFAAVVGIVGLALPLTDNLRAIGAWRPTANTPHPPVCAPRLKALAEALFWDQRAFDAEMKEAPIRYRLTKSAYATFLGRLHIQWLPRAIFVLTITSLAIQLATLPLMVVYFNRVAPVGVLLNVFAGLLTAVIMLGGLAALVANVFSAWLASKLALVVTAGRWFLVNAVVPFNEIPGATFRAAHYDDWHQIVYVLYFIPLILVGLFIDGWQPVVERRSADTAGPSPQEPRGSAEQQRREEAEEHNGSPAPPALFPASRRFATLSTATLLLIAIIAVVRPIPSSTRGRLTVHFLDVGQGDAALVIFPRGSTMLIDAGGELRFSRSNPEASAMWLQASETQQQEAESGDDSEDTPPGPSVFSIGEAVVSRFIWSQGRTEIDYALATHAHADHIGGLCDVVKNINVAEAVIGHAPTDDAEFDLFAQSVDRRSVPVASISRSEEFELDGVRVEVLWPRPSSTPPVTSGNDDSVVLRLTFGSVSILLPGDIEQMAEAELVNSFDDLHADVLKVPHHGSRTSSTEEFLDRVHPALAIVSVGERSRFGHPHQEVVARYDARGVRMFQTGRDGTVTVETDGSTLNVSTYRDRRRYSVIR